MKESGEWEKCGRPEKVKIDPKFINAYTKWKDGEMQAVEAMELCGMANATFYRKVKQHEKRWAKCSPILRMFFD